MMHSKSSPADQIGIQKKKEKKREKKYYIFITSFSDFWEKWQIYVNEKGVNLSIDCFIYIAVMLDWEGILSVI